MSRIENKERRFGQAAHYHVGRIDGEVHLFTDAELTRSRMRAIQNAEDLPTWDEDNVSVGFRWNILSFLIGVAIGVVSTVFIYK